MTTWLVWDKLLMANWIQQDVTSTHLQRSMVGESTGRSAIESITLANANLNVSTGSLWTTYFGRPGLDRTGPSTQREPPVHVNPNSAKKTVGSMAFQQHSLLAELGIDVFRCNHAVCTNIQERVQMGKQLQDKLLEWYVARLVMHQNSD
jgi:hypothetical protein